MILPTPPPSIRPQRTGDSDELPDYEAPSPIERARVAQEHKRRFGQGWPEDYKDPTGLQLHERAQRAATGETELAAFPASGFRASFGGSSRASLSGSSGSSSADALMERLLQHATSPPRFSARVRGSTSGGAKRVFDFVLDAGDEMEAGIEGGRRGVMFLAEGEENRLRATGDLECGAGCLGAAKMEQIGSSTWRELPGFVHLSSLVDMGSPNASLAHPPQLHQGLFIDTAELHSTGLQPAADYPQYSDITRQHEARAMGTRAAIERFCASSDPLKRLVVEKEVYGWDLKRVRAGLESSIKATADVSSLDMVWFCDEQPIVIRSDSLIARLLELPALAKALLCLTIIYPIFLIICHLLAPSPTRVRLAFPLASWRLLPPTSGAEAAFELASTLVKRRPTIVAKLPVRGAQDEQEEWIMLAGTTEGEWLSKCEARIREQLGRAGGQGTGVQEK